MSKSDYSTEDFVLDPDFKNWVLEGNASSKNYWEEYLRENPSKIKEVTKARAILLNLSRKKFKLSQEKEDFLFSQIEKAIQPESSKAYQTPVIQLDSWSTIQKYSHAQSRKKRVRRRVTSFLFFLLIGMIFSFFYLFPNSIESPLELQSKAEREFFQAPPGVKSTISLEDGSKVFLNSGSSISYQKGFTDSTRIINLQGEAFFEVAKDSLRPFTVKTGSIATTALGTSFNISSFPNEPISIALISGVVVVSEEHKWAEEKLMPGEGIQTNIEGKTWKKERFDVEHVLSWMNKTLIFDAVPFKTASRKLENWYGVEITFNNPVPKDLLVSGKFKDETLENILIGLSYSSGFEYEIQGKNIQIRFKP